MQKKGENVLSVGQERMSDKQDKKVSLGTRSTQKSRETPLQSSIQANPIETFTVMK